VLKRSAGPVVVVLVLGAVGAFLAFNLNLKGRNSADSAAQIPGATQAGTRSNATPPPAATVRQPANFREYPIGDEVEKNGMLIKAVWLPPV
jgi:uncharacterized protein involved in high-affinity Fe2+ transport